MDHLPIQMLFGDPDTGPTEEASGCGSLVIGQDLRDLTRIGCPAIGNQGEEAGSGSMAAGSSDKLRMKS